MHLVLDCLFSIQYQHVAAGFINVC